MSGGSVVLDEEDSECRRQDAGEDFEFAADMNAPLPFVSCGFKQIYFALGLMISFCVLIIIELISVSFFFQYFFGIFFFTILTANAIFIPDILNHWWHWILQTVFWGLHAIVNILLIIIYILDYNYNHNFYKQQKSPQKQLDALENKANWVIAITCIGEPILIMITLLMVRMAVHGWQNRQ